MRTLRRLFCETAGQALVEFALTAPLILLIAVATLDFGRALNAYITVSNASREGMHYAILDTSASADVAAVVRARAAPLNSAVLTVTTEYSNDNGTTWIAWSTGGAGSIVARSTAVRVTVSYPWSAATAITSAFFSAGTGSTIFTTRASGIAERPR